MLGQVLPKDRQKIAGCASRTRRALLSSTGGFGLASAPRSRALVIIGLIAEFGEAIARFTNTGFGSL
jgi:hypothetical protein